MSLQLGGGGNPSGGGGLTGRYTQPDNFSPTGPQKWYGSGTDTALPVEAPAPAAAPHPSTWKGFGDFFSQLYNAGKGLVGSTLNAAATPVNAAIGLAQTVAGDQKGAAASRGRVDSGINDVKGMLQAVPRGLAQVGMSYGANPLSLDLKSHLLGADHTWTPSNTLTKAIFGDAPVQSLANVYNTAGGSTGNKLGALAVASAGDLLLGKGVKGVAEAPKAIASKAMDNALSKYSGTRAQAALGTLANADAADAAAAAGAAKTRLQLSAAPGGKTAPLALPAETPGSQFKTTTGPNAGTFENPDHVPGVGNSVSPATVEKIQNLDDLVHRYNQAGPHPDSVKQLGTLNAMRLNAAATVKSLAEDRAAQTAANPPIDLSGRPEPIGGTDPVLEAHKALATGTDQASLHYQHALEVAKAADAEYQAHVAALGGHPVSDINTPPASEAAKAEANTALGAAQAQAEAERNPQIYVPDASAESLLKHLSDVRGGRAYGSELPILNELIQHPDISNADKANFVAERDALLPRHQGAPTPVPTISEGLPNSDAPASKRIAFDYNPDTHGASEHVPVPASELHPGARNVFSETLPTQLGDIKGAPLSRDATASVYHGLAAETARLAKGLKPENIKLIDQIESPASQEAGTMAKGSSAEQAAQRVQDVANKITDRKQRELFLKVVDSMKKGKDTRYLSDTAGLQRELGYRHNHLTHEYETRVAPNPNAPANGVPGYTNARVFMTKAQAAEYIKQHPESGLKLKDTNAVEAHINAMKAAGFEHGDEAFRQAVDQAHPGAVVGKMVRGQYDHIIQPNGVDLANVYNKRSGTPNTDRPLGIRTEDGHIDPVKDGNIAKALKDNPGSRLVDAATGEDLHSNKVARIVRGIVEHPVANGYDKVNQALKTSVLGGGTFHGLTTAGTVAGQQLVRGALHPLEAPRMIVDNLKVVAGTFSKAAHEKNMTGFRERGTEDFGRRTGITLGNNGTLDTGGAHVPIIHHIHDAVFQRQIPEAKLTIMEQAMAHKFPGIDFHEPTPEQVSYGRKIASQVNNLGGINRAIEGMTPKTAKMVGRFVLAPDYTEGKLRTIVNALNVKGAIKGDPAARIALQAVVGKSVLFAIPGLTALTLAGKIDWSNPQDVEKNVLDQFLDPSIPLGTKGAATKTNPGGVPQSVHFPSTFISEIGKIIKPALDPLSPDKFSGLKDYVTNRAAAAIGVGSRLYQNKDFYGKHIYGTDENGNPISPGKSALNALDQGSPIPLAQASKQLSGQQGIRDSVLNTLGFRVSSDSTSDEAAHSAGVNDYYNALKAANTAQTAAAKKVNDLVKAGKKNEASRAAAEYNATIPGRFQGLREKYPDYDPAKDSNYKSLQISPKITAINTRAQHEADVAKTLSAFK